VSNGTQSLSPILVDADSLHDYAVGQKITASWHEDHVAEVSLG
jgi:hypothetical protein